MKTKWRKVVAPQTWRPKETGEELIGQYLGRTLKTGSFGQYEVIVVATHDRGTFLISGTRLIQLVDAAPLFKGDDICIVFQGHKQIGDGDRMMKMFELYVADVRSRTERDFDEEHPHW